MSIVQDRGNPRKPLWWGLITLLLVAGGGYGVWLLAQRHTLDAASETVNIGAASAQDQAGAESTFNTFVTDIRRHAFDQALQSTSNTYPSPHSASSLMTLARTKLAPLVAGGDLQFEPIHSASHGSKLVLRAQLRADGKPYRTVCTLTKEGNAWRISNILPPVAPGAADSHSGFSAIKASG